MLFFYIKLILDAQYFKFLMYSNTKNFPLKMPIVS